MNILSKILIMIVTLSAGISLAKDYPVDAEMVKTIEEQAAITYNALQAIKAAEETFIENADKEYLDSYVIGCEKKGDRYIVTFVVPVVKPVLHGLSFQVVVDGKSYKVLSKANI